jgi:hypothetical protein
MKPLRVLSAALLLGCGFTISACGGKRHAAQFTEVMTRVESSSTVIQTLTHTLNPGAAPSPAKAKREAFAAGFLNCRQLPIAVVRRAVLDPSYRPKFIQTLERAVVSATGGDYPRAAAAGCLKALRPRIAHAERVFGRQVPV